MPINHVIKLLQIIDENEELRNSLYKCNNQAELITFLNSEGYYFNDDDIENAVNHLHVQCQTLDEARILLHKAEWLKFLIANT